MLTTASLYKCLGITTGIVIVFSILGLFFKDLSFMGNIMLGLLISLLGLTILSIFVPLPFLAYRGLGIFCLYLMYEINSFKLKSGYIDDDMILNEVMNVYLVILNILLYIIQIFADTDD
jgi:FtsH-binding integral membrane protein